MNRVLVVGAGGVGNVIVHKCLQSPDVFSDVMLASRTLDKCERIRDRLTRPIRTAQVDADNSSEVAELIREFRPAIVMNAALPYQDLSIMEACLDEGTNYLDTANYEPPDVARFEYKWQWDFHERYRSRGIMALLGCGFDPGVTNIYCAYTRKRLFDRIEFIDIFDCNGGDHGRPFATNFNPEINIREVTAKGRYWEDGRWVETDALSVTRDFDFPGVGVRKAFLMYHEELESLIKHFPEIKRIRFWMTFSEKYLMYLRVLQDLGLTRIDSIKYEGHEIAPLKFLKTLLPDPATLGESYTGRTSIGVLVEGTARGRRRRVFIYNVCDHQECYRETGSQAVSYTTGVAAVCGAKLTLQGRWRGEGVFNVEEFDPDPFMADVAPLGLPWHIEERAAD
jgi:saccharopine dehydrogenase (NAD+, L-lysine-forming)